MHHKKKRSPSARGGPKLNKPWKMSGVATESKEGERFSARRRRLAADAEVKGAGGDAAAEPERRSAPKDRVISRH